MTDTQLIAIFIILFAFWCFTELRDIMKSQKPEEFFNTRKSVEDFEKARASLRKPQ